MEISYSMIVANYVWVPTEKYPSTTSFEHKQGWNEWNWLCSFQECRVLWNGPNKTDALGQNEK